MTIFRARLLIIVAALLWSTSGFFTRAPWFSDWPEPEGNNPTRGLLFAFWRALFAGLVVIPFVRRPTFTVKMVPLSVAFVTMNVVFLAAMVLTTPANAVWLQYTAPVLVFFVGVYFFGEKIVRGDWIQLLFIIAGVSLILRYEWRGDQWAGVVYGILSAITYGTVVLSLRLLRDRDSAWLVGFNLLLTAVCLFPFVLWQGIWPSGGQLVALAAFGVLQMGVPYFLFARAVRTLSGHEAAAWTLLEPIFVPVWVWMVWGDPTRWWSLVGGGLILFGLAARLYLESRGVPTEGGPKGENRVELP